MLNSPYFRSIIGLFALLSAFSASANYPKEKAAPITITGSSSWEPFSFIDKDGLPQGIMVDFWRLYAKANNINIRFQLEPWSESLELARDNAGVIHGGLGYSSSRAKDLAYSSELPLEDYNVYLFVRKGIPDAALAKTDNLIIGSVKNSLKHEFISARMPQNQIRIFDTFGELNDHAYRGDVDLFIDDLNSTMYDLKANSHEGLFTPRQKLYTFPLHFATNKASRSMLRDIERGIEKLDPAEISAIYLKWHPQRQTTPASFWDKYNALYWLFCLLLATSLAGISIYRILLGRKTKELHLIADELRETSLKLEKAAYTDVLTGTLSRESFFKQLSDKRFSPTPYALAVLDIDHFKRLNDCLGHNVGDVALKHLAAHIKNKMPVNTLIARLGGGEFVILFDYNDAHQAVRRMEKLHHSLSLNPLQWDQQQIDIAFSAGVTSYPLDGDDGERLLQIAAQRMRSSKENGRNQTSATDNIIGFPIDTERRTA